MKKILWSDVKVNGLDFKVSIASVDPVGFITNESGVVIQDDIPVGVSWDGVQELVVWAFNLGYDEVLKDNN